VKNSRFSEEQIIEILKQSEAGAKTSDLCRQHDISGATFYAWRSKYGGMDIGEAKRLKQLEEENAKLKRIVADQALDITKLKDLLGNKMVSPEEKRAFGQLSKLTIALQIIVADSLSLCTAILRNHTALAAENLLLRKLLALFQGM
jgi:putative transposase